MAKKRISIGSKLPIAFYSAFTHMDTTSGHKGFVKDGSNLCFGFTAVITDATPVKSLRISSLKNREVPKYSINRNCSTFGQSV